MIKKFIVSPEYDKCRLDKFLSFQLSTVSRSKLSFFIKKELVKVNDICKKNSCLLKTGDQVVFYTPKENKELKAYPRQLPVIWEDNNLLVINKPAGLVVHPHGKNNAQTLVNALIFMKKKLSQLDPNRPGIVHRLDKETSGVMVLAKDNVTHQKLVEQFKKREINKEYLALVWGHPRQNSFVVSLPLRRKKKERLKMEVGLSKAKTAETKVTVIKKIEKMALLAVSPKTGRMHQIRVHLKFAGFPIVGDKKYGKKDQYKNLFLHAKKIKFKHPQTGEILKFQARPPQYFQKLALA